MKDLKKYQASKDFIHKKIAGSDVLISIGANVADFNGYIQINESAVALWDALQEPCDVTDLERVLKDKYDVSNETAAEDVAEFMNILIEHKMISEN